jgi:hypothetical protein
MMLILDNDLPAPLIQSLRDLYVANGALKQNLDRARSFHAPEQQAVMDSYLHQHLRPSFHLGAPKPQTWGGGVAPLLLICPVMD